MPPIRLEVKTIGLRCNPHVCFSSPQGLESKCCGKERDVDVYKYIWSFMKAWWRLDTKIFKQVKNKINSKTLSLQGDQPCKIPQRWCDAMETFSSI